VKVKIIYFSGTGNTKAVAQTYDKYLSEAGHSVSTQSIEEHVVIKDIDLLIIGGPIYAGNMPDELINWVRKNVPKTDKTKAVVFSTSAVLGNAFGVLSIGKKLTKKGYQVIDKPTLIMPRNFYVGKYDPTPVKEQKEQFYKMLELVKESVVNINPNASINFKSSIGIDLMADLFRMMAKKMGKNFKINEGCIDCGICEKNCPKSNIDLSNKSYLNKCILCTRCIHNCPVNVISYKGKIIEQYTAKKILM